MRVAVSLALFSIAGCSKPVDSGVERSYRVTSSADAVVSQTAYDGGSLKTVRHDKHLFVVECWTQKGAILHHPDCPCFKQPHAAPQ